LAFFEERTGYDAVEEALRDERLSPWEEREGRGGERGKRERFFLKEAERETTGEITRVSDVKN
jgi:hypothetical protein